MKKIILTLLLTLSALVNVNAATAFSLDVDNNGSLSSSNDGLVIFKYLLNPDANNLHTTIANDAAEDRKTSAQLKAYLDGAGDILDVDGNKSLSSSNDGLVIFKYLLNPNSNNLHTTIANDAVSSKTTTIDLKTYLDQYISTAVITTGTATVTGNFSESDPAIGDQNGDNDTLDDGTYVKTFITELIDGVEVDTSKRILIETIYTVTNNFSAGTGTATATITVAGIFSESDSSIGDQNGDGDTLDDGTYVKTFIAELEDGVEVDISKRILIETIYTVTNDVDPPNNLYSGDRPTELTAEQIADADNAGDHGEHEDVLDKANFGGYYSVHDPSSNKSFIFDATDQLTDIDWIENANVLNNLSDDAFKDLYLKITQAIWDLVNPPTFESDLTAIFASDTAPTELTPLLTAEANRVIGTETTVDNKELFTNLSGDGVDVTYGGDGSGNEIFAVSSFIDGNSISNNIIVNQLITSSPNEANFRSAFFDAILEKWNQLHPSAALEDEITAIYEADLPPTELTDLIKDACESYGNWTNNTLPALNRFGVTFTSFDGSTIVYNGIDNTNNSAGSNTARRTATLEIMTKIWHVGHPNYVALTPFESELADIYAADAPPTGFVSGGEIESATSGFTTEITSGNSKIAFIKRLSSENHLIKTVYQNASNSQVLLVHVNAQNVDLSPRITSPVAKRLDQHTPNDMVSYALEVVKAIWLLEHPEYVDLPALRTERIAELEALDKDGVTVTQATAQADGFVVSTAGKSDVYFYANDYGSLTFEGLTTDQYTIYTAAIEAKRDEYILAAELAALRTTRIAEINALDKNDVVVQVTNGGDQTLVYNSTDLNATFYFHFDDYGNGNGKIEDLSTADYATYKADIISKRDELDPISTAKIQAVLETFYNGSEAAALDINNYGGQLSAVSTLLATAANAAFDNGLAAQETFLKLLAHGASFQGSPSKVLWDSTGNYYHIVTSNVGSGNGYFDIFLDDNHHYLPNANPGTVMVQNNFRHLAYHVIANLWHLADTTDAELRVFREDWLESYTTQNGAIFNKEKDANDSDQYRASTITNSGQGIATSLYGNVQLVEDLSLTKWVSFRDVYTFSVTTLLGL